MLGNRFEKLENVMIKVRPAILHGEYMSGVLNRLARAGPTQKVPLQPSQYCCSRVTRTLKRS